MQALSVKETDKILIIAPHPDDECIGAGGLLALYPHLCTVIVLTDGRLGQGDMLPDETKKIREHEFTREMLLAGVKEYKMLGYQDGTLLQHTDCLADIDLACFHKIFVTGMHDNHPDHSAACISVLNAIERQKIIDAEIYLYEVHCPMHEISHMLDITDVIEKKSEFIRCHKSQLTVVAYDEMSKCLAKFRALQNRLGNVYIEVYYLIDSKEKMKNGSVELENRLQKSIQFYRMLTKWVDMKISGKGITDLLINRGITDVAVYGYAELGKLLVKELNQSNIEVAYILDKKVKESDMDNISIYVPQKDLPGVSAVIVTAVYYYDAIQKELMDLEFKNIISLESLLE